MGEGGRKAVVTGASSGIGRETAKRLVAKGFTVIAAARRKDRLEELKSQVGNIVPMEVDLSKSEDTEKLCQALLNLEEPVSVLVNNAGYSIRGALEDVPPEALRRVFEVNLFSLIRVTQACLPGMRRAGGGRIINVSSMVGKFAFPMSGVYAATKHALEAVTDALREEVLPFGIRVAAVRPGFTATEFNEAAVRISGDLTTRTDPAYKPLYEASAAAIGKMFAHAAVPGPEVIADLILEAVESPSPKAAYSGSFLSEEFLGRRAEMDDDAFSAWLREKIGLAGLRV